MALNAILPELECLLYSRKHRPLLRKLTSSEKMLDAVSTAKTIDNHIKYQTIILGSICVSRVSPRHSSIHFRHHVKSESHHGNGAPQHLIRDIN